MKSMTGFGSAEFSSTHLEIEISIRTVNGRYFEPRLHLPKEYLPIEPEIKKRVSKYIKRGTVDVYILRRSTVAVPHQKVMVNRSLAKKWLQAYRELAVVVKTENDIKLSQVAAQPGVIVSIESAKIKSSEKKEVLSQLEVALTNCLEERLREGQSLQKDLRSYLLKLKALATQMWSLKTLANKELAQKYQSKLEKLMLKPMDESRVAQEIVMQLDKADISEEIARLKEHVSSCISLLLATEPIGKKLDFYCQELLREVNTIGSKSQLTQLTQIVVESKAIVEKFREQVQNVE